MSTNNSDKRSDNDAQDVSVPDDPQADPEQAVDALDERVFGTSAEPEDETEREKEATPAFEQDMEPEEQGSAAAGAAPSG